MRAVAQDPQTRRWWRETDPCQIQLPGRQPGANWSDMGRVFFYAVILKGSHIIQRFDRRQHVTDINEVHRHEIGRGGMKGFTFVNTIDQ